MKNLRLLYLDVAFEQEPGGDKNRSRFLWQSLTRQFDAEFLLLEKPPRDASPRPSGALRIQPVARLRYGRGPWYESDSVMAFDRNARRAFQRLLSERPYDVVFSRFHSPWQLACLAEQHPSRPAVVVDLDMLSSRLVGMTWKAQPVWRNRWFLIERWKLEWLERRLYRRPFLVFLSNPTELDQVQQRYGRRQRRCQLRVLPNVMPPPGPPLAKPIKPVVLFFGSMNSAANVDGFRFLLEHIWPRVADDLERADAAIHVVGKNPPAWFREQLQAAQASRIVLVGAVDSMEETLAECRFVLLPLRIASGTRTRVLEAAAQQKAVVTTSIGAEGLDLGDDALVRDDPEGLAQAVRSLLADSAEAKRWGERLYRRCTARYAPDRVGNAMNEDIGAWVQASSSQRTPAPPT